MKNLYLLLPFLLAIPLQLSANGTSKGREPRDSQIWFQDQARQERERRYFEATQKVIVFKSSKARGQVAKKLVKSGFLIVAVGKKMIVVRPGRLLPRNKFRKVLRMTAKLPQVASIQSDKILYPVQELQAPWPQRGISSFFPEEAQQELTSGTGPNHDPVALPSPVQAKSCSLYKHCGDGSNPQWGKLLVGADFAEEMVDEIMAPLNLEKRVQVGARVAVLDTGFDEHNQLGNLQALSIDLKKGIDSAGNPRTDIGGHGTPVTGMISAKNTGITKYVNLSIYRVTEKNQTDKLGKGVLSAAIERACQEGDIVNVSWASFWKELGIQLDENPSWMDIAKENGCLVVFASGNSGIKEGQLGPSGMSFPFINVAATNGFSNESSFATQGHLRGPGENVFSLFSKQSEMDPNYKKRICRAFDHEVLPVDGTSFAAPLVTGVGGQVITVLKARNLWPEDPLKKIELVKSILYASEKWAREQGGKPGIVSAVGAVAIARGIGEEQEVVPPLPDLVAAGRRVLKGRCEKKIDSQCLKTPACEEMPKCLKSLRFKALACPPGDSSTHPELLALLKRAGEDEMFLQFARISSARSEQAMKLGFYEKKWQGLVESPEDKGVVQLGLIEEALSMGLGDFNNREKMAELFNSSSILFPFRSIYQLDLRVFSGQKGIRNRVTNVFMALPEEEQIRFLLSFPNLEENLDGKTLGFLLTLRQTSNRLAPAVSKALNRRLRSLAKVWARGDLPLWFPSFEYHTLRPIFTMLFDSLSPRDQKKLKASLGSPMTLENQHFHALALGEKNILPPPARISLAKSILADHGSSESARISLTPNLAVQVLMEEFDYPLTAEPIENFLLSSPFAILPDIKDQHGKTLKMGMEEKMLRDRLTFTAMDRFEETINEDIASEIALFQAQRTNVQNAVARPKESFTTKESRSKILNRFFQLLEKISFRLVEWNSFESDLIYVEIRKKFINNWIVEMISEQNFFSDLDLKKRGQRAMIPIRDAILKNPETYSQSFRTTIRRFYNLPER